MYKLCLGLAIGVLLFCFSFSIASANEIKVIIDGREITFEQPPAVIKGTVMVPMRGVFEEFGADVKWKSSTQTITAKRDATVIILQIGSLLASVNGKTQQLTTPATMLNGRTLVPLRFISEALGAEVKWQSDTRTVIMSSGGSAGSQIPQGTETGEAPLITNVKHNAAGALKPGDILTVTLTGDPGCKASFDLFGVKANIPMRENSPGSYSGEFTIPQTAGNIQNASVFGRLNRNGKESMRPADNAVALSAQYIKITKVVPEDNSTVSTNRPNIMIVLEVAGANNIDTASVRLVINNQLVSGNPAVSKELISYALQYDLPQGKTVIDFSALDAYGNPVKKSWSFNVKTSGIIRSITHSATAPLAVGETLQINMQGDSGGKASFDIAPYRKKIVMVEASNGLYIGNYKIQSDDNFQNAFIIGYLEIPGHDTVSLKTTTGVSVKQELTLQFTAPQSGSTVERKFLIKGLSSPGAKIALEVKVALGIFGLDMDSNLVTTEVQADGAGNFQYEINDWFPASGGSYTITGKAQDAQGQQSGAVILKVNRQ